MPYVQRLELEYHFPAYTGLEPQKIEDGGDIAVLRGTEVRVHIFPTMKTPGGRIALNDKESMRADAAGRRHAHGAFKADQRRLLPRRARAPTGERVAASPQYTIDVLADQPPTVSFKRPGRDTSASPIEEVFVEASAEDDYGVRDLELVYSVNGGAEKTVKLFDGTQAAARGRRPGHTFYLEELGVQPGDFGVVLRARRRQRRVGGAKQATSDLYFLRIRPFKKDFRQAQSQGGGGGGGGGGGPAGRRAVGAAAADHLGDVQRPARSQDDERRQAARELDGRRRCRRRSCASRSKAC